MNVEDQQPKETKFPQLKRFSLGMIQHFRVGWAEVNPLTHAEAEAAVKSLVERLARPDMIDKLYRDFGGYKRIGSRFFLSPAELVEVRVTASVHSSAEAIVIYGSRSSWQGFQLRSPISRILDMPDALFPYEGPAFSQLKRDNSNTTPPEYYFYTDNHQLLALQ